MKKQMIKTLTFLILGTLLSNIVASLATASTNTFVNLNENDGQVFEDGQVPESENYKGKIFELLNDEYFTDEDRNEYTFILSIFENSVNIFDDSFSIEINHETGDILHTDYDVDTGKIMNQYTSNYYKNVYDIIQSELNQANSSETIENSNQITLSDNANKLSDSVVTSYSVLDYPLETVYKSNMPPLDASRYIVGKLKWQNVDVVRLINSKGQSFAEAYSDYNTAPSYIAFYYSEVDQTVTAANDLVSKIGLMYAKVLIAFFAGAIVTVDKVEKWLDKIFGLSLSVSAIPLTTSYNNYIKARNKADEAFERANKKITWEYRNGKWYLFYSSGEMATGWYKDSSNKWYYLDPSNGQMAIGWRKIDGYWYYFYSSGIMATNTVIDGWKIGSNGVANPLSLYFIESEASIQSSSIQTPVVDNGQEPIERGIYHKPTESDIKGPSEEKAE